MLPYKSDQYMIGQCDRLLALCRRLESDADEIEAFRQERRRLWKRLIVIAVLWGCGTAATLGILLCRLVGGVSETKIMLDIV